MTKQTKDNAPKPDKYGNYTAWWEPSIRPLTPEEQKQMEDYINKKWGLDDKR